MWLAPAIALGVARAGDVHGAPIADAREPDPDSLVHLTGHRVHGRAAAAHRRAPVTPRNDRTLRVLARQTWRFFDELIVADGQLPGPGQLSAEPPGPGGASNLPDQHRPSAPRHRRRLRLRYIGRPKICSIDWSAPSTRCCGCHATVATSSIGTTPRPWRRCAPAYISTVDSGNLAGYLLTLRSALDRDRRIGTARRRRDARRDWRRAAARSRSSSEGSEPRSDRSPTPQGARLPSATIWRPDR